MKIATVEPGQPGYGKVTDLIKKAQRDRVGYDAIATQYNALGIDAVLLLDLAPEVRIGNIERVLTGRGLTRDIDYCIARPRKDSSDNLIPVDIRPVMIKKLSAAKMALKQTT
jgi:hypothetical protein